MTRASVQSWIDYDYALVRVVPYVHLCSFVNVGVVLHARTARYLDSRLRLDHDRLLALYPSLDLFLLERYFNAYQRICRGDPGAAPVGLLPPSERFHWLTAPRSVVIQTSEVHTGRTISPADTLNDLFRSYVHSGAQDPPGCI